MKEREGASTLQKLLGPSLKRLRQLRLDVSHEPGILVGPGVIVLIVLFIGITVLSGLGNDGGDGGPAGTCVSPDDPDDCALITEAREAAAEDNYARAVRRYEEYLALPEAPLAEEIGAELAALHVGHAQALEAEIRPTTGMGAVYDYVEVLQVYGEAAAYPETEAAQGIPAALDAMYATAMTESGADSECDSIVLMNFFAGNRPWPDIPVHPAILTEQLAPIVADVQVQLSGVLFRCGTAMYDTGYYVQAITWLEQLLSMYPDDPNIAEAQATLESAREEQARVEAENAERIAEEQAEQEAEEEAEREAEEAADRIEWIDTEMSDSLSGTWDEMDDPDRVGSTGDDSVKLTIYNSSPVEVEVLTRGQEPHYYTVDACGYCAADCSDSATVGVSIELAPGDYEIVIRATSGDVTPLYGYWELEAGNEYAGCYYVNG